MHAVDASTLPWIAKQAVWLGTIRAAKKIQSGIDSAVSEATRIAHRRLIGSRHQPADPGPAEAAQEDAGHVMRSDPEHHPRP
jgi:hypothetical protein